MKKFYTFALLASVAFAMSARQLSPEEAMARLNNGKFKAPAQMALNVKAVPALSVKAPDSPDFTSLYVFENSTEGYMIVSADDCAVPLLGYSDTGRFDTDNMPSQLRYWLDFYAAEIEYAASQGADSSPMAAAEPARASIAPMLKTQWNQNAPFNNDCPTYNGKASVTGCVATAMAQAMNYHQWPVKGTGSNSYSNNGSPVSCNFSSITFDWNNMADVYNGNTTSAQNAAVAQLMFACGVSVNMQYTSSESGASSYEIAPALYNYFGYSDAMRMPQRAYYTTLDWENMVYDQLAQGMPVLYDGVSSEGGHQFVCDGYSSNGYFHFNWGWSGMSDGYYLLSALDPTSQGIGGSTTGFNYQQGILINMKPASATLSAAPLIYCYGNFEASSTTARLGSTASFTTDVYGFLNFGCKPQSGNLGIKIVPAGGGNPTYVTDSYNYSFPVTGGLSSIQLTLPSNLSAGTYTVTPVFLATGASTYTDVIAPLSATRALKMTVNAGIASFSPIVDNAITISNFDIDSTIYLNTNFKASFTVKNTGTEEYYGQLMMGLADSSGNQAGMTNTALAVDVAAGESSDETYVAYFASQFSTGSGVINLSPGTYTLVVYEYLTGKLVYQYPNRITIKSAPTNTSLTVSNFAIQGGTTVTDPTNIVFTGNVECTSGYYGNQLIVAVFPSGASETTIQGSTDFLFLNQGDSDTFSATVDLTGAQTGDQYSAYVYMTTSSGTTSISNRLTFRIGELGVIDVVENGEIDVRFTDTSVDVSAPAAIRNVTLYSIDGIALRQIGASNDTSVSLGLSDLLPGNYILVASDADGHTASRHFAK